MSDIVWGEPIEVNGVRPEWLRDDDIVQYDGIGAAPAAMWGLDGHGEYRLPASHPFYTVQRYNAEHGTSFVYWPGGDYAPDDWDLDCRVLFADGGTSRGGPWNWGCVYKHPRNIIGYTRRAEPKPATDDSDYVRVRRMTEDEWRDLWFEHGATELGECLGIIKPEPTEAERIAAKTGLTPEQVQVVLDAQNA